VASGRRTFAEYFLAWRAQGVTDAMRRLCLVFALTGMLLIVGCNSSKTSDSDEPRNNVGGHCAEPENPYDEGTGHYAGYEWAQENGSGSCNGSSESFNEGCEDYETQDSEYEECEARKK
jgi:hypothetical protein